VGGLLAASWAPPDELVVIEPVPDRRDELAKRYPGLGVSADPVPADGAVIAVKPDQVEPVARQLAGLGQGGVARVLSIAAGVTLGRIEGALGDVRPVVRAMPNTPALVGAGAAAIAAGTYASDDDLDWAEGILGAVGVVVRVKEDLLDAVTGLSGSGPAYV